MCMYETCALFYSWIFQKDFLIVDPEDPVHRRNALVIIEKMFLNMIDNEKFF